MRQGARAGPGELASALLIGGICLRTADAVRQRQALIHLLPEELTPLGRHGIRAVVQITAEIAEGIADAAPIAWGQLRLRLCHGLILVGSLEFRWASLKEMDPLSLVPN